MSEAIAIPTFEVHLPEPPALVKTGGVLSIHRHVAGGLCLAILVVLVVGC